ncbi:MAG: DUF934 domain-containing protein [Oxalobacter sp.]|jgi:uncharacterized protein (DUF934 family)|nr:MAG: DUF934 domain-containing protein [Oxalobacter sp.]
MSSSTQPIIKNNAVVDDDWIVLHLAKTQRPEDVLVPDGKIIVPLKVWLKQKNTLQSRANIGVLLSTDDDVHALKEHTAYVKVIAVNFPKFTDGRGYTIAYKLRSLIGYQGELRAIGDIQRDQLFYLQRVGFDAFAPAAHRDPEALRSGLSDFSVTYQASWDERAPIFRRVNREGERA